MTRACAQLKTQGIARRSSMRSELVRDAGRDPIFSSAISMSGVIWRKKREKPSVPYTSLRYDLNASAKRTTKTSAKRARAAAGGGARAGGGGGGAGGGGAGGTAARAL